MATTTTTPHRSLEQRRRALVKANRVRSARKDLKRDVKAGRRTLAPLLADPPDSLESMCVFDLLVAVPKVGRVKASKMLGRVGVSPSKTVGGLSGRQRRELLTVLGSSRR